MLVREELEKLTVDKLRSMCKELGISYYENGKRLPKAGMIDKMVSQQITERDDKDAEVKGDGDKVGKKATSGNDKKSKSVEQSVKTPEQIAEEEAKRVENKKRYIENAKVGTIVAFTTEDGKVISAMIEKKSTSRRKFMLKTAYGAEFKVDFDDVLWVRTNKRWPKGIYQLFKKNVKAAKEAEENETEAGAVD